MLYSTIARPGRASRRASRRRMRPSFLALSALLSLTVVSASQAQRPAARPTIRRDSVGRDSVRRDSAGRDSAGRAIERVLVSAIRAGDLAPIAQTTLSRTTIRQRHFVHQPISPPERFGLRSQAPTLEAVLELSGLPRRG